MHRQSIAAATNTMKFCFTLALLVLGHQQSTAFSSQPSFGRRSTTAPSLLASSQDTPETLPDFENAEAYLEYLDTVSAMPKGFATGTASGKFISKDVPSMGPLPIKGTVIHLTEGPTDNWAAVYTSNKFPGAPVKVGRRRLANGGPLQALVINNKVSNVCSGGDGEAASELVCKAVADALKLDSPEAVLPSSTGIIGWRLPAEELANDVVPVAVANLQTGSVLNAAKAIMTTDRYPKVRSRTLSNGARVVGIAKGAGMIEPNMATMLAYVLTDATVPKADLQRLLKSAVDYSFNAMSVDGDESTSDTAVLVASNQIAEPVDMDEFETALFDVCKGLAADIVRNGEGTSHVMRVKIDNFPGEMQSARFLGRHIVNSPLFKCAVAGNDPNTGRLAAAIGSYMGKYFPDADVSTVSLTLGGRTIFENGKFVLEGDAVEKEVSDHMEAAGYGEKVHFPPHQKFVEIGVDFGSAGGDGSITVLGSDLTGEYVVVNADYRS